MAMVQLLLGNMGMPGGGINALRGHSNIQGLTDLGLLTTALPGYIPLPNEKKHPTFQDYLDKNTPTALRPNQLNYWKNTHAFRVSSLKCVFGDTYTTANAWASA